MVCCDWPDRGQMPLWWPGARSQAKEVKWGLLGSRKDACYDASHPLSHLQMQAGNVSETIATLFFVFFQVWFLVSQEKKMMQYLLKFITPRVVKGTPDCILSWALGLGWKRLKCSKCRKIWRTGAGCSCSEATLTFLCSSPICWLCIAFSNCSRPHDDQQINVHSSFSIFTSKGLNTPRQCFPLHYFMHNSKTEGVPILIVRNESCSLHSPLFLFLLFLLYFYK